MINSNFGLSATQLPHFQYPKLFSFPVNIEILTDKYTRKIYKSVYCRYKLIYTTVRTLGSGLGIHEYFCIFNSSKMYHGLVLKHY